jgi:hypothetical protein
LKYQIPLSEKIGNNLVHDEYLFIIIHQSKLLLMQKTICFGGLVNARGYDVARKTMVLQHQPFNGCEFKHGTLWKICRLLLNLNSIKIMQ